MSISFKVCCATVLWNLNLQEYPEQTGSWRALRPKKKKEEKFHQLLENDVKFADEQEGKTVQILFASDIYKENDLHTRKGKTRKRDQAYIVESRVKEESLILKDHTIDIQATKEFANVIAIALLITLRNHEEWVIYWKNGGG